MTLDSRVRAALTLVVLLCARTQTGVTQTGGSAQATVAAEPTKVVRRPIELEDIVQTRQMAEQQLAPDGLTVAFVVRQARLTSNDYHDILYTVEAAAPG